MQATPAKPVFVVGSPRSGTSILTWCLGQHPNLLPVPESNWMGDFARNLALSYETGAARENRSVLSAMDISVDKFFTSFGERINELILAHRGDLKKKRELDPTTKLRHSTSGPKQRWVDGTPEYSLHICGLRKLFPDALFIHLVRDVDSVVRSLLNFHRVSGRRLVANEEDAYNHWLRRVKECLTAEQAYGPAVVRRVLYSDLVDNPETTMRSLLDFVGEPYSANCLEPLAERINSSNVPVDFKSDDPGTDPATKEEARRLSAEIRTTAQPNTVSAAAAEELETAFRRACLKIKTIEHELREQIASQEKHYLAEIDEHKMQIAGQQRHYLAEIEEYKALIQKEQQHYAGEIEEYKALIRKEQQHYLAEIEGYKSQLASQERHYTGEAEEYQLQLARQEQYYTTRVAKQLGELERLAGWLDELGAAAARLRSSRVWRFVNKLASIEAKLLRHKGWVPDRVFEKISTRYSRWRRSHLEIARSNSKTDGTESAVASSDSDSTFENLSDIEPIENVRGTSA